MRIQASYLGRTGVDLADNNRLNFPIIDQLLTAAENRLQRYLCGAIRNLDRVALEIVKIWHIVASGIAGGIHKGLAVKEGCSLTHRSAVVLHRDESIGVFSSSAVLGEEVRKTPLPLFTGSIAGDISVARIECQIELRGCVAGERLIRQIDDILRRIEIGAKCPTVDERKHICCHGRNSAPRIGRAY